MPLFPPLLLPPPAIISNEDQSGSAVVLLTANAVYVYAFEINTQVVIVSTRWRTGTTGAGTTSMGIYVNTGNNGSLVAGSDTGAQANAVNTIKTFTYGTAIILPPGAYFIALSPSSAADDYQGVTGAGNSLPFSRGRLAANAFSSGMPPTLGSLSSTTVEPMMSLLPQGGLT